MIKFIVDLQPEYRCLNMPKIKYLLFSVLTWGGMQKKGFHKKTIGHSELIFLHACTWGIFAYTWKIWHFYDEMGVQNNCLQTTMPHLWFGMDHMIWFGTLCVEYSSCVAYRLSDRQDKRMDELNLFIDYHTKYTVSIIWARYILTLHLSNTNCCKLGSATLYWQLQEHYVTSTR